MEINWSIVGWIAAVIFVYIFGIFEGRNQGRKRAHCRGTGKRRKTFRSLLPETVEVDDPGFAT